MARPCVVCMDMLPPSLSPRVQESMLFFPLIISYCELRIVLAAYCLSLSPVGPGKEGERAREGGGRTQGQGWKAQAMAGILLFSFSSSSDTNMQRKSPSHLHSTVPNLGR